MKKKVYIVENLDCAHCASQVEAALNAHPAVQEAVEIELKYAGYIARQQKQVEQFAREEARLLPPDVDYMKISGLRIEAQQKLSDVRPLSVGQASRISGVSPSDIAVLLVWLSQRK